MNQQEKFDETLEVLDSYEKRMGLPKAQPPGTEEELQEYLSMDRETIEKMSGRRAIAISVRLSQFAFYIQRCLNRSKAIVTYAEHVLNQTVAQEIDQYDQFTKHEMKMYQICRTNSVAREQIQLRNKAKMTAERFHELSSGIKNLSYTLSLIIKSRETDG